MAAKYLRENESVQAFGEDKALPTVLKELTSTYLICKECFDLGKYPRVLSANDFEQKTIKSILSNDGTAEHVGELKRLGTEDREKLLLALQA